ASFSTLPAWKSVSTSSQEKIGTLKSWLEDCDANHPSCKPTTQYLPKRLIEVGSSDSTVTRLVESAKLSFKKTPYCTLSYCWGHSTFKTTSSTLDSHRKEIPDHVLPKTYRDATGIARTLSLGYIWIDALCIVQDDQQEWRSEAAKMQDTYAGSIITIAATDAADTSIGCYPDSPEANAYTDDLLWRIVDGSDAHLLDRVHRMDLRLDPLRATLNTRGWILQEMILSNRVVHCMRSGVCWQWQCRTSIRSETGVELSTVGNAQIPILAKQNLKDGDEERQTQEWHRIWQKWMESYSLRKFTLAQDRLPALAGLTRHYELVSGDESILGLWKKTAIKDLLWVRTRDLNPSSSPQNPAYLRNVPSWTWLSCQAAFKFDFWGDIHADSRSDVEVKYHLSLADWGLVWQGAPFISPVEDAFLVIEGPVRTFHFSISPERLGCDPQYMNIDHVVMDLEDDPIPWECVAKLDLEPENPQINRTFLCLLVKSVIRSDGRPRSAAESFLMLEPVKGTNECYRRVGMGHMFGKGKGRKVDDMKYGRFDGAERKNIRLV
ncbi:HET-domain-containing protein, partial [Acephala macrosclerotiorum]